MADIVPIQSNKTPFKFSDTQRPLVMVDADRLFERVLGSKTPESTEIIDKLNRIALEIRTTSSRALSGFWDKLEKRLNTRSLAVQSKTDDGKILTALSTFYTALNSMDVVALTTDELVSVKNAFDAAIQHIDRKLAGGMEPKEKRIFARIKEITDNRYEAIAERFNEKVEAGQMAGAKIEL